uniref:Unc-51 like kinase 4 n=1 Tax=Sparus aurata TaxID=8175 RepID=A0A671WX50_SPAAU
MENFILYEELGAGSSSVVYKGRKKGNLNYVAIICADKAGRPHITNHVRLTHDLNHPNIVCFYEWYETSNHLWLVVELCTGGSLESVISHDGCLSEDVVRGFGWDLVKGLKHIHESGIIFSDLTPAKIQLDGSGSLKFGNFCMSKAEGETLEDLFAMLSASDDKREEDSKEHFENMIKRLQGSPTYSAPEVLQGSETSMSSDLWALGCILYYMYTGTHIHTHTHRHTHTHTDKCIYLCILFLFCSLLCSDCCIMMITDVARSGSDTSSCVKALLHTDSDLIVTPIMDNPKILKSLPVRFDSKTLCVPAYSVEKLQSLSDEEWAAFLIQLHSSLGEQNLSAPLSNSSTAPPPSTTIRAKLNLLCYLCCVVGHKAIANRLINSTLLPLLTQQLRRSPNWDVRNKVLRVMGLLALHCTELREDSPVSEVVSTLTDLLRDNMRNSKVKQLLLPPLGEFLYLITSQEEKRGSPEGLWFVPAAAYTGLMRSLREGDDSIIHHMAAKIIENISTTVSGPSHYLFSTEIGSALWYLFTHSTVEAVRVTAISSLSRLTRMVPAVFLAVIDTCGPAAILDGVGGAGARVQQHLLTAMATALLTSRIHIHRVTQNRDLVLKVLRCLESPSTVTRAKASLLLLLLIQDNTNTLLFCCQHRLVMYVERDLRKATPLRENPSQSGYLSQCLDLLIVYMSNTAPLIMEDVLCALRGVIGRRHPSTAQSRQLKHTLPTMSIVLELLSSQVACIVQQSIGQLRSKATTHFTLKQYTKHFLYLILMLSFFLCVCIPVEWSVFVLRVLSELSLVLLVQESDGTEDNEKTEEKKERSNKGGKAAEGVDDGSSCSQMLTLILKTLLPRYESLLRAAEPIPLYALKLLVSMTEHSTHILMFFLFCTGLIELMVNTLSEAALVHLNGEGHAGRKVSHLVLQALLELLHNILKQTSVVVRSALQLSAENQEVWEESIHCLSLLVQLYGGEGYDCLSPSCLRSFSHVLRTHMHTETPRVQRTTFRIIKRLVSTVHRQLCLSDISSDIHFWSLHTHTQIDSPAVLLL